MNRCVIIGGADINDYARIKSQFLPNDYYIFCDSGLKHITSLKVKPDLIIGDFDSYTKPKCDTEIIELPVDKDDTDTVFAVKEAIKRGFRDFLLVGVVGNRLDHSLANTSLLLMLDEHNLQGKIIDNYSEIEILSKQEKRIDDSFSYFSLLSVFGDATGVNIYNAKYPLNDAEIRANYQFAVSNEPLKNGARVSLKNGKLLLIKVY